MWYGSVEQDSVVVVEAVRREDKTHPKNQPVFTEPFRVFSVCFFFLPAVICLFISVCESARRSQEGLKRLL